MNSFHTVICEFLQFKIGKNEYIKTKKKLVQVSFFMNILLLDKIALHIIQMIISFTSPISVQNSFNIYYSLYLIKLVNF